MDVKRYKPTHLVILVAIAGTSLLCLLGASLCLFGTGAFWVQQRQAEVRQQKVSVTANEIFDSLYIPPDAVLLDKVESYHALAYARDCTGTLIEAAYGINRPLDEVMAEYDQQLLRIGWKPDPGRDTSQIEGYAVYKKDSRTELDFNTNPVWTSWPDQDPAHSRNQLSVA